jgi:hypothetical protein
MTDRRDWASSFVQSNEVSILHMIVDFSNDSSCLIDKLKVSHRIDEVKIVPFTRENYSRKTRRSTLTMRGSLSLCSNERCSLLNRPLFLTSEAMLIADTGRVRRLGTVKYEYVSIQRCSSYTNFA